MEAYKQSDFDKAGITTRFMQDNHSRSDGNVLRGLHFQRGPMAQGKLVRVVVGAIFDVAVDIRAGSPTLGSWVGERLSEENHVMLFIPPGFAHGFYVLSDRAEVSYKTSAEYSPDHDAGIIWDDPDLGIKWPCVRPLLSEKDANLPRLRDLVGQGD